MSGGMVARTTRYNLPVPRPVIALAVLVLACAGTRPAAQSDAVPIPYPDARPILDQLGPALPEELARRSPAEIESMWADWVVRRGRQIRDRLVQGEEDTIVNFLLFGTSFTRLPRAVSSGTQIRGGARDEVVGGRIDDLVSAVASPGESDRLRFARSVLERRGIDLAAPAGREQAARFLRDSLARVSGDAADWARAIDRARGGPEFAVRSSLYRTRGLSSDTSIKPDFAIDQALAALGSAGILAAGSVRRVAVIGPGLDFTDKAEGYDFYPQQTTQPFSVIDSLLRLGLAGAGALRLTTLDLSPRVNLHVEAARQRARSGAGYLVVLPRDRDGGWPPALNGFWRGFGQRIGEPASAPRPPEDGVDVRAVRVRPEIVLSIDTRDVNVVLERLASATGDDRFDLVVATNVLVYYDVFEQSLALANIASMLRPGGVLLSNNVLVELPTTPVRSFGDTRVVYSGRPDDSDQIVWYRRQ